jgi:secreted trypsin-like serine protease
MIVNGTVARPHNYPWMAFLTDQWSGICGGSIITDKTILTAGKSNFITLISIY